MQVLGLSSGYIDYMWGANDDENFVYVPHPVNYYGGNHDKGKLRCINTKRRF